jgi:hypothetical protein
MTSKEKAIELLNKYNSLQVSFYKNQDPSYGYAKQCALIAVDEIIDSYIQEKNNGYIVSDKIILYWQEVKQEIINL